MNFIIRSLCLVALLSFVFACHKPSDDDGADADPANYRISRVLQDALSAPAGKMSVIDFTYDDRKRVTEIIFSQGDSVNGALTTKISRSDKYFYNGTTTTPYKVNGKTPTNPTAMLADIYYSFNNSGLLTRDSITAPGGSPYNALIRNYTYPIASKIIVKTIDPSSLVIDKERMDSFIVNKHNITEAYYGITPSSGNISGYLLNYDDKVNPINKLNIAAVKTVDGINGFPDYLAPGSCQNNITEYHLGYETRTRDTFFIQQTYKLTYTYNKAGLPETCTIKGPFDTYTVQYIYKKEE